MPIAVTPDQLALQASLLELQGPAGAAEGEASQEFLLTLTFGGGVNEIQRELIATARLGLPRAPR